ncbi:hypothetical protein Swol_1044 [Syntrophomonas wolfei subsp. wolfei str. Goettingen G311]|uniref:Transcobalamin-like C-terminal domain-containing protein n=1 Tax=Syntrophomonas wolfei subsp. wolfei (strain DSM 2245B / Goettingen) TaxID=335541 RepID=Q0AY48_SYNWW|nr:hypothetical protein Swol_1044 [Syntrophomonas wolfei subsp. wolfei str. Goettingen G311]
MKRNFSICLLLFLLLFLIAGCHSSDGINKQGERYGSSSHKASVEPGQERLKADDTGSAASPSIKGKGQGNMSPAPEALSSEDKKESLASSTLQETPEATGNKNPVLPEPEPDDNKARVRLLVTQDNGEEVIFDQEVELAQDVTVMDILKAHLEVSSSYGGEFVEGINGLKSKRAGLGQEPEDWFYYINGSSANVGAASYRPAVGDVIWWDYHSWGSGGR